MSIGIGIFIPYYGRKTRRGISKIDFRVSQ